MLATPYGRVDIRSHGVTITATHDELVSWSQRPSATWPCSTLADMVGIAATFDANGLVDLDQDPAFDEATGEGEVAGDEFDAWSSDVLRLVLPEDHPAYFVAVGQFS